MHSLRRKVAERLDGIFSKPELDVMARELLCNLPGVRRNDFYLEPVLEADNMRDRILDGWLERLVKGEPLQYVLGFTDFCGVRLKCDPRALIPRQETSELVEWVAEEASAEVSLLDIGTGTGCIAIALAKKYPGWCVSAWDISLDALELANENAVTNGVTVNFCQKDILEEQDGGMFDIIVSNPPYIALSESAGMEPTVLEHEPHIALFVPDCDPLQFYRAIGLFAKNHLKPEGSIYLEINPLYADRLENLLEEEGFEVQFRNDISQKRRMAKIHHTNDN
ncbi:MAG: peptide chain release factor N(5)-glutamine methyltransferase [Bacteroidaceae bacterium]|nr:peptide chain release factor N(5)-glutamine methyltransferase [Bacteroidaceae bacterium]